MSYLNDPREQSIDTVNGYQWEADNRVEERWKWGASILDLCGMSPEDYQTTIFHTDCGGSSGGGGGSTGKASNPISVSVSKDEDAGDVIMYAVASKRVYAPVSVVANWTVYFDDGSNITGIKGVVDIPEGEISGSAIILSGVNNGIEKTEAVVTVGATEETANNKTYEDEVFKYTVSDITPNITIYYGIFPYTGDVSTLSLAMLSAATSASFEKYPIDFVIPIGNGDNAMSQEELDNEAVNYVLVVPTKYDGKITLTDQLNNSILSLFPVVEDATIPDMTVYMRVDNTVLYKGSEIKTETYNITIG